MTFHIPKVKNGVYYTDSGREQSSVRFFHGDNLMVEGIITGIVTAAISSWIAVQLSLRKFHLEKWWERRADAYSVLIEALHVSKAFCDENFEALCAGRHVSEERDKEQRNRAQKATDEIQRAIDIGAFLFSDEALEVLKRYTKDQEEVSKAQDWYQYLETDLWATSRCLKDIIEIARKDLKTDQSWLRRRWHKGKS